jgi:hypothetical protein
MPDELFWRDSSGRLTFSLSGVEALEYPPLCRTIIDNFRLTADGSIIIGLEQMYWEFRQSHLLISLDWDIWMDFMVVARSDESEPLVRDIAAWLGQREKRNSTAVP